jgi:triacylglycerol lipase
MGKIIMFLVSLIMLGPSIRAEEALQATGNSYPILLLHGWTGWGRDEMNGFKYWGGRSDIQAQLNEQGYDVRTVAVGPISSNWDRACEFYAFVKGDRVDYGAAHATQHGHARFGRQHDGIMPDWGHIDDDGKRRKVHILTHSMGGQTVRQLVELLYEGSQAEVEFGGYAVGDGPQELFTGGKKDWVRGVATLAAPHDGSSLANALNTVAVMNIMFKELLELLQDASLEGVYDLKLDQWEHLAQRETESFYDHLDRVLKDDVFKARDFSIYDLSPEGARELNQQTPAKDNIYYFSWGTLSSRPNMLGDGQHGDWHLLPPLTPLSLLIGTCLEKCMHRSSDPVMLDGSWLPNDGIVNTRSMSGPTLESQDVIASWSGEPKMGQWNFMGVQREWDHLDMIGLNHIWPFPESARERGLKAFYEDIVGLLQRLPE